MLTRNMIQIPGSRNQDARLESARKLNGHKSIGNCIGRNKKLISYAKKCFVLKRQHRGLDCQMTQFTFDCCEQSINQLLHPSILLFQSYGTGLSGVRMNR